MFIPPLKRKSPVPRNGIFTANEYIIIVWLIEFSWTYRVSDCNDYTLFYSFLTYGLPLMRNLITVLKTPVLIWRVDLTPLINSQVSRLAHAFAGFRSAWSAQEDSATSYHNDPLPWGIEKEEVKNKLRSNYLR